MPTDLEKQELKKWAQVAHVSPAAGLEDMKIQAIDDFLGKIKPLDLSTNNGDIREDAQWRDGWNSCLEFLRQLNRGKL